MVAWGPIIGAGISAISSLFGDDDDKETTTTVDYGAMARAAEKAGFNPLTALRNGGSAGFTTTSHPALSMEDRFGQAFSTLGNALMSFDARADDRAALEDRLMQAQIENLNRTNRANSMSFAADPPSAAGSSTVNAAGRPLANPPISGQAHPYGEPQPLYKTVWWIGDDNKRYEQHIPNIDVVPDDPSGLGIPPLIRFGNEYDRSRSGPATDAQKPQGSSGPLLPPKLLSPTVDPQQFAPAVKQWFEPWKGELW